MAWSTNYTTILTSYTQEWLQAKGQPNTKARLLATIGKEIQAYRQEKYPDEEVIIKLDQACISPSS
jgi:hypothetical protein